MIVKINGSAIVSNKYNLESNYVNIDSDVKEVFDYSIDIVNSSWDHITNKAQDFIVTGAQVVEQTFHSFVGLFN